MGEFGFLGVFLLFATLVPVSMLMIPWVLTAVGVKPHRPNKVKNDTYECGMQTMGGSWVRFNFRYYFYALLFVIFAIETVFLYPWAVQLKQLRWFGFFEMLVFILILAIGLVYAWRKKALEWR